MLYRGLGITADQEKKKIKLIMCHIYQKYIRNIYSH